MFLVAILLRVALSVCVPSPSLIGPSSLVSYWPVDVTCRHRVHYNAIFDICWLDGDRKLATASGDQTSRIFDAETGQVVCLLGGKVKHKGSVKSVKARQNSASKWGEKEKYDRQRDRE